MFELTELSLIQRSFRILFTVYSPQSTSFFEDEEGLGKITVLSLGYSSFFFSVCSDYSSGCSLHRVVLGL